MNFLNLIKQNYYLTVIIFIASFLRLYHLDFQSMWMDEIYTMNISNPKLSFLELHQQNLLRDGFPDFYFLLLRFFYFIFGYSEFTARLVSSLAGIGGVYVIYLLGKEIFNKNVGLMAAFLLCFNDFHIYYSQEARPYTLFLLTVVFSFYRLSIFIKNINLKNAIWYGISCGLILNIHLFGIITLFSQSLIILCFLFFSSKQDKLSVLKFAPISGIIALVMLAPNYQMLIKILNIKSFWVAPPTQDGFTLLMKEFFGNSEYLIFIFSFIFVFYLFKIFNNEIKEINLKSIINNQLNYSFLFLFSWFFSFLIIILVKTYSGASLFLPRYFISVIPVFIIVLAIGIDLIKNHLAKITVLIAILLFSYINLISVKNYYCATNKTQFREIADFVIKNNTKKEVVNTNLAYWFDFFLNTDTVKTNLINKSLDAFIAEMIADPSRKVNFWHADGFGNPYKVTTESQQFLDENFIVEKNIDLYDSWTKHYVLKTAANQKAIIENVKNNAVTSGLALCNLSDENWTGGVAVAGNTLLFDFSPDKVILLKTATKLTFKDGKTATISGYEVVGNYIHVHTNESTTDYKQSAIFPNLIQIN